MINTTKIAKNNIKHNKSKSILIILTIILSTTLLSCVAMTCLDWNEANKERIRAYYGTQHGIYTGIDESTYEMIKTHADIDEIAMVNGIGTIKYEDKTKIGLGYTDNKGIEFNNIELIEGEFPTEQDEISIDDLALEKLGYEKKLNQKIKIQYKDYHVNKVIEKEFTISGITKTNELSKSRRSYSIVVSEDYMRSTRDMSKEDFNVFITLKDYERISSEDIKIKVEDIGKKLGISKFNIRVNEDYINNLKPELEIIVSSVVLGLIIILTSILVIYNIFYLSIVTKIQEFGKLIAIGTTKNQIKSIILKEGIFLSMIAIPIGLILGYLINEFILAKVLFDGVTSSKLFIIIFTSIISLSTVIISLLKPMKVASKVSVIDALRYNGQQNISKKKRKGHELINLRRLVYANLNINKKRTYITLISLTLSGILFIVASSILNSMDAEVMARKHHPFDIRISLDNFTLGDEQSPNTEMNILQMNNPLNKELIRDLQNKLGVNKVQRYNQAKIELSDTQYETIGFKYDTLTGIAENDLEDLEYYLIDGKIDLKKLKDGKEILVTYSDMAKKLDIKAGDNIKLTLFDGDEKINKEFKVQAITDGPGIFAIHDEAFYKIVKNNPTVSLGIYTDEKEFKNISEYVKNIDESNDYLDYGTIEEVIENDEKVISVSKGIVYSLSIIIGAIGFINLINSMITSTITRKKELGMLQAIGLTDKQLVKMLNIEAMFFTSITLISTVVLGGGLGYLAVYIMKKTGSSFLVYSMPITQILIMAISVVIAQLALTHIISKNFNKESLIDRVRYND